MKRFYDSKGNNIANEVNGHLHSTKGKNIGHLMSNYHFFIDRKGYYLGEIILENRLVYQKNHPYKSTSFGDYGDYGNVGDYGNPGNIGGISLPYGYEDIPVDKLK